MQISLSSPLTLYDLLSFEMLLMSFLERLTLLSQYVASSSQAYGYAHQFPANANTTYGIDISPVTNMHFNITASPNALRIFPRLNCICGGRWVEMWGLMRGVLEAVEWNRAKCNDSVFTINLENCATTDIFLILLLNSQGYVDYCRRPERLQEIAAMLPSAR